MAQKKEVKLKCLETNTRRIRNFLVSDEEWEQITEKANAFAGGNVSAWLRYAGQNMTPKPSELTAAT